MNLGKESEIVEFKESTSEKNEACDSISAILNKKAKGTIYFGVKNNGDVIGQLIGADTERSLSDCISQNIEPRIFPSIESFLLEDNKLVAIDDSDRIELEKLSKKSYQGVIKVSFQGDQIPYSSRGRFYKRVSDQDQKVTTIELRKMLLLGKYDPILEAESDNQELTFNAFTTRLISHNISYTSPEIMEKNLNFYNTDGKHNLFSLLLSDQCPFSIKVVHFKGIDKTSVPQINELGRRSLIDSTTGVIEFCKSLNETRTNPVGMKRETTQLFDDIAFREAWLNAVLHTNWLELIPPAVYFFNDRVEIISHGGLPYDLSEEEFFSNTSDPVNPALFNIFNKIGLGDQTGHGVSKIVNKYGRQAFNITEKFITVTLKYNFTPLFAYSSTNFNNLSPIQKKVLNAVITNPYISLPEISGSINESYGSVIKAMSKLKELKLLTRKGTKKNGIWVVLRDEE